MSDLIRNNQYFFKFLTKASDLQIKAVFNTITPVQLKALREVSQNFSLFPISKENALSAEHFRLLDRLKKFKSSKGLKRFLMRNRSKLVHILRIVEPFLEVFSLQ